MNVMHVFRRTCLALGAAGLTLAAVGCAAERPEQVPKAAGMKAEGNERVVWTAPESGQVWVTDAGARQIVYSGRLNRGDRLVVDTRENHVAVNDVAVVTRDLPVANHQVYFEPGVYASPAARVEPSDRAISNRPAAVPAAAVLSAAGRGSVQFAAPAEGEVWIVDADDREMVYGGRVLAGETVAIDNDKDVLTVGGRSVLSQKVDFGGHNHEVYYLRGTVRPAVPPVAPAPVRVDPVTPAPAPRAVDVEPGPGVDIRFVPAGARVLSESAERAEFVAANPGRIWVVNATTNETVYTTTVRKGDVLTVDPANSQVILNGRGVTDVRLATGRHRILFEGTAP